MTRKCAECPAETVKVCRHAFGNLWNDKSNNGEGCDSPMDHVAEAWKAAGCKGETVPVTVPLALPKAPVRPRRRPTVAKTQLKVPTRPKVSAKIMRQADLFFSKKN